MRGVTLKPKKDPGNAWFSFLTPPHPPQAPGRSPSPSGFWWSSDRWQWAGRWVGRTGSDPAASGSTTWPKERQTRAHTTRHGAFPVCTTLFSWHAPWFVHHDVLLAQEALLDHPLVTQELGPRGGKKYNRTNVEIREETFTFYHKLHNQKLPLFSHVVTDGVGQDDHAALALLQLLGDIYCRCHGCPRAASCDRADKKMSVLQAHIWGVRHPSFSRTLPQSRPSSLISMRLMLKDSSSSDLYQVSITWNNKEISHQTAASQGGTTIKMKKRLLELTDLSSTVGMKSYPIPSTSYWVLSVLLSSSGSARMEPSGSTPTICAQHTPFMSKQLSGEAFQFLSAMAELVIRAEQSWSY